ncbi:helix-turn-helix transcriptional regulator [Rhizobium sp. P32RR-XVIII]|uniref:helix-turn-helix domain-containing protein n=1 Tax=Rhizobium sp. P32RR-XVIII TaxID=2726738 RepID=UPI001456754D|nr:helix-turn-helix transcriptional regulator [Rhizobium sp. P32RR-XVIII]NLS03464.1 helix-turn-helix transcriptional regulator [Rhizobium sp. P32RR-XVIII]
MLIAPAIALKVAREFLGLSQDMVEAHSEVSRSTIQRVESGRPDLLHYALRLQHFYETNGIAFVPPANGSGWGVFNNNTIEDPARLHNLPHVDPRKRRAGPRVEK